MRWIHENKGKICIIAAVVFFLAAASVSSYRIGSESENGSVPELSLQQLTAEVQTPFSGILRGVSGFFSDLIHFRDYAEENRKLKKENAELKKSLTKTEMSREQLEELKQLSDSLQYVERASDFREVAAEVVSLDRSGVYGILTISAGSKDGVQTGDIVIGTEGLIGRVITVTGSSAKVSGIINTSTSVSFYVQNRENSIGVVTGDGKNGMTGYLLDNGKKIKKGDVLMTSGLGRYPAGIEIGTVTSVNKDKTTSQVNIDAAPSVDFYSAGIVAVFVEN